MPMLLPLRLAGTSLLHAASLIPIASQLNINIAYYGYPGVPALIMYGLCSVCTTEVVSLASWDDTRGQVAT